MSSRSYVCQGCGEVSAAGSRGPLPSRCPGCRAASGARAHTATPRPCHRCGELFTLRGQTRHCASCRREASLERGRARSAAAYRAKHPERGLVRCQDCRELFDGAGTTAVRCHPCRVIAKRESVKASIAKFERETGRSWHSRYQEQRNARSRELREERKAIGVSARQLWPAAAARGDATRIARERGASIGERFSWREVAERDGLVCALCGELTDPEDFTKLPGRDGRLYHRSGARYPSLDHVVALASGGRHELANAQLAHFGCNARKGARLHA